MTGAPIAVLCMAYGSPEGPGDVAEFYTDVRRGRAPTDEQLADLTRRYDAIGGTSPLRERAVAQVAAVQRALDARAPGAYTAYYGTKHARPKIEDTIDEIAARGHRALVGLVLAPHFSEMGVGEYLRRSAVRAQDHGLAHRFLERWGDDPALIELLADRLDAALVAIGPTSANPEVLFSAHSLPTAGLETGDRYAEELAETARLVAARARLAHYRTVWQSAGRTPGPWLGPDITTVLASLPGEGFDGAVVVAAGFTSDHLEVCYDLDVEAARKARALGLAFCRAESLNDDPRLGELLARRVCALHPVPDARR